MKMKLTFATRTACAIAAGVLGASLTARAQDYSPLNPPLADLARQSRALHAAAEGQPNNAQKAADEIQREQDAEQSAPAGFKNYDAGDYRLYVPFPYDVVGRDSWGVALAATPPGSMSLEVMVGTPIPIRANSNDSDLSNAARQLASRLGQAASCSPAQVGTHKAFRCEWQNNFLLFGRPVWGSMEIIAASNDFIPVMCLRPNTHQPCLVYDSMGHNTCADPDSRRIQNEMEASDANGHTAAQICEQTIYPSITLKEDRVAHPAVIGQEKAVKPVTGSVPQISAPSNGETPSLGDLARQTRLAARVKPQTTLNNSEGGLAPKGFQSFVLQYCQNPQHCAETSVVIPEKSEVVSDANGQYIFKAVLNGDPVMLYAGPAEVNEPYRSMTNVDYVRIRDLANPNGWSRETADAVSTQELTVDGRPALMTRFRYLRDEKVWWVGERTLIQVQPGPVPGWQLQVRQMQTGQFLVGCTAPEPRFADAEALCTTLVNSLRLQ